MIRWFPTLLLAALAICMTILRLHWLDDSSIPVVRATEAAGAVFPREAHPEKIPSDFNPGATEGTPARKCINVPIATTHVKGLPAPVWRRSGEIIVGGFIGAMKPGVKKKVPWATLHDPASRKATLVVQGVRLDQPTVTARFISTLYGYPVVGGSTQMDHAFFPTGFVLPTSGRWLLTVTSGNDWGCFIVRVSAA